MLFALVVYIVVPGGAFQTSIPMEQQSCLNGESAFNEFPNTTDISMSGYCRRIN